VPNALVCGNLAARLAALALPLCIACTGLALVGISRHAFALAALVVVFLAKAFEAQIEVARSVRFVLFVVDEVDLPDNNTQ